MNERTGQHTGNGSAMGFIFGALLGAGVALLLAPAKGSETRHKLGETARRLRRDVPAKARGLANQARSTFGGLKEGVHQGINEGRSAYEQQQKDTRSVYSAEREGA
ncbi:MAG TPA: YtxH domain-containing protein [Candidatus Eisenbacteria bacterium]|nr:YtxH domain-containing protein [Candidatus Eisenbacteria bacterium]